MEIIIYYIKNNRNVRYICFLYAFKNFIVNNDCSAENLIILILSL